jgi:hypothetical protein
MYAHRTRMEIESGYSSLFLSLSTRSLACQPVAERRLELRPMDFHRNRLSEMSRGNIICDF